jgi:MFS family permease
MTALNDAERAAIRRDAEGGAERALPEQVKHSAVGKTGRSPEWLPSRRFIAAVIAIGGMQLLATMDSTVAIVALPKIQDELSLSDAGRSWVITAYVLTFGGLMLLGGRLGDTIGRKRTFIVGVALFTIASILCGVAWDETTLVIARLLQGVGAAIASPTGLALIATTFPKGPARNAATAVFAAMTGVGSVMGLILGGALTEVSWRLAFLVNVPVGLLVIYLARTTLRETHKERLKLDAAGAILATLGCTAAVFGFTQGPENGWVSVVTIGSLSAAGVFLLAFLIVERTAQNPVVPFSLFRDRNRVATFAAIFLAGGVMFTLTVLIGLYVQDILGYSALRAGIGFIPFVIALGVGLGLSSHLVSLFDASPWHPVLPRPGTADRDRRLRHRHDRRAADRVGHRGRGLRPDRAGVGDRADAAEPRRPRGAGGHSGRHHVADAVPRRHHRSGEEHGLRPVARPRPGLHLRPAVGGRRGGRRRRRGAVHRIHRRSGRARARGQGRDRPGRAVEVDLRRGRAVAFAGGVMPSG